MRGTPSGKSGMWKGSDVRVCACVCVYERREKTRYIYEAAIIRYGRYNKWR